MLCNTVYIKTEASKLTFVAVVLSAFTKKANCYTGSASELGDLATVFSYFQRER